MERCVPPEVVAVDTAVVVAADDARNHFPRSSSLPFRILVAAEEQEEYFCYQYLLD